MKLRKYTKDDYQVISEWFKARDLRAPPIYLLPSVGFLADDVAAGFLIQTDCHIGILDFFVTNPASTPESRGDALEQICSSLMFFAAVNDMKHIRCDSSVKSIKERVEARGFKKIDNVSVFYKEL